MKVDNSFPQKITSVKNGRKSFVENKFSMQNFNFDVVSTDWGSVVDADTFITFLQGLNGEEDNIVEDFNLSNGRLTCNMSSIVTLDLTNTNITEIYTISASSILSIILDTNQIAVFNPSSNLPLLLEYLSLGDNEIVSFNPTIPLPPTLTSLFLNANQIVTFNPTIALPSSLTTLSLESNQIVTFNPTIALPSSLINLRLNYNQIVTFNPTIALPNSLTVLLLGSNLMTSIGYLNSVPWATNIHASPVGGTIDFIGNSDSASGTSLEALLLSKGWAVNT